MSDLREALETAYAAAETAEVEPKGDVVAEAREVPDAPALEAPAETAAEARARDEKGRFAAKAAEEAAAAEKPAAAPAVDPNAQVVPTEQPIKAPNTWRPAAAAKFATLDPEIRAEIEKRENDARMGIQQYKQAADFGRAFNEAIKPFEQTLKGLGAHPVQAVQALFAADHKLRYSPPEEKARYFAELAAQYGVQLDNIRQAPQPDPQYLQMQQELNRLRQQQDGLIQERQQAEQSSLLSVIDQFQQDPANQHFEAVKGEMALLLENGRASDLKQAYDMAVWMRPDIRAGLLQQQTQSVEKSSAEQQRQQRAAAAARTVKGSTPASGTSNGPKDTLRAQIEAAAEKYF